MKKEDVGKPFAKTIGSILMIVGSLGGLVVGILVAVGAAGQQIYGFTGQQGQAAVWLSVLPFLLMILIASFMLSGREQFVDEMEEEEI